MRETRLGDAVVCVHMACAQIDKCVKCKLLVLVLGTLNTDLVSPPPILTNIFALAPEQLRKFSVATNARNIGE